MEVSGTDSTQTKHVEYSNPPTIVSFFCGCGGLDLGFRGDFVYHSEQYDKLPFNIVAAYDYEKHCVDTYNQYFGPIAIQKDLSDCDMSEIPKADILIGGFPCQEFSSCGPLGGLNSERGQLYRAMVKYAEMHKPKIVVGENVVNLGRMDEGSVIQTIIKDFEGIGYRFERWDMNAYDYGVPQNRSRILLVGVREDLKGFPIMPEPRFKDNHRTIKWAIGDLEDVLDESVPNQSQYFKASKAKKGNGQGDEISDPNKPSYTMRANPKSRVQFHYNGQRRLTIRECARIQTFPDDFIFSHSMTTSTSEIGNAVPPILAYQVASSISDYVRK